MKYLFIIITLLFATGCCSVRKNEKCAKRKIEKALKHHPEIIETMTIVEHDTLIEFDTLFSEQVYLDTLFDLRLDTVFEITEGKVTTIVKVVNRDVIHVQTRVESDTIILNDTIINERIREIKVVDTAIKKHSIIRSTVWFWLWLIVIVIISVMTGLKIVKSFTLP